MSRLPAVSEFSRRDWLRTTLAGGGACAVGLFPTGLFSPRLQAAEMTRLPSGKHLLVHTDVPLNAEPELEALTGSWITPFDKFYVRSHAPVPDIDPRQYRLKVEGLVEKELSIGIDELFGRFERHSVVATMCCAGNRRNEQMEIKPIDGVPWEAGPLGNAEWSGCRLIDVLNTAGIRSGAKHVWFEGLDPHDKGGETIHFGGSIPLDRVINDDNGRGVVLLADRMNGEPLSGDHGAPLRTVVPGYIGARSVKWLGKIVVSDRPSDNHYIKDAYKIVDEATPEAFAKADPIVHLPLQSVITRQSPVHSKSVTLRGYALPTGRPDRPVTKVQLSADGGETWQPANLISPVSPYCWQLWEIRLRINSDAKEILVRAEDAAGETQPREGVWNAKGYMWNGWYKHELQRG